MEDIYKKYSKSFCISESEAENLINQNYNHENNQERLLNLLGYENIEDVAYIITNINVKKKPTLTVKNKYVEICIKPPKRLHNKNKVSKKCVKEKYQSMFEYEYFNDIQSAVFETAYYTNKNFLLSAPTGCGKTDVAMLVILHALEREGKVFLIAPMKALATEIYSKTRSRLRKLNVNVLEYTGDSVTSYDDLSNAKVIIATPEKFDIMTRKLHFDIVISTLIIDEIHILHNTRGAVIETIVCRMLRHTELFQRHIRIVGLSATLPNYKDVAKFIQAQNTFYFEPGYRPVPLEINLIGVKKQGEECDNTGIIDGNIVQKMEQMHLSGKKEIDIKDLFQNNALEESVILEDQKSIKTKQQSFSDIYNEILEEKIAPLLEANQQVLVFVTSRKESEKTANYLRYKFTTKKFDIHHAGLSKIVRHKVEKNFKDKKIDVIATTSTLAWGVNLPAKCVIIKGTQFYDHESAKFENLGILDVLQIFGRAGRPQFDSTGHAFLITDNKYLNEYYELLNNNTLVESKLLFSFIDIINCEIYLKNIRNLKDAVDWLKTTFLFVRMLKTPLLYGFSPDEIKNKEIDMVLSEYVLIALKRLNDTGMITMKGTGHDYVENTFYHLSGSTAELMTKSFSCSFKSTFLGRVASFYFINFESVNAWVEKIQFVYDEETILDLLLSSKEFDQIILREDEIDSLRMFADDIQVDFVETPKSKMKMLYYLDKLKLNTHKFSLSCDQTYVIENLERIVNAFNELIIEYELFNLHDAVCEIKRTVSKSVFTKKNTKVVTKSNVKITQIGDYTFIESSHLENIIVDKNDVVIFVTSSKLSFFRSCDTYFTIRKSNVEYVELSANEILYKFGVHTCKEVSWTLFTHQLSCPHYTIAYNTDDVKNSNAINTHETDDTKSNIDNENYTYTNSLELLKSSTYKAFDSKVLANPVNVIFTQSYNFTFEIVDGYINIENQKLITYNILELPRNENYLIITTDKKETSKTYNDIKMYNVINNIESATDTKLRKNFVGYMVVDIKYVLQNIKKIQDNCVVIFKGVLCNHFYPIFDILKIAGNRKCIVYDTRNVIEYLNYLFAQ